MSNWQRIREARTDLTDYVVHLTRFVVEESGSKRNVSHGFRRLKEILRSGVIRPTHAPRTTVLKNCNHTVRGPYPAACFTAQPLEQIPVTLRLIDGAGYQGYGIAVNKVDLYRYGGRPVIYGDNTVLESLKDKLKYLWVCYRPIRPEESDYPNDFTFEREWRCRVKNADLTPWDHEIEGVPLLLPEDFHRVSREVKCREWKIRDKARPDFRIVVAKNEDVSKIRSFVMNLKPRKELYFQIYYEALKLAQVISLEHVHERLEKGDQRFRRIEDLRKPTEQILLTPVKYQRGPS